MFRKQSIKSRDQQNQRRIKKNKDSAFPLGKPGSNAPISSTFPSSASFDDPPQGCLQSLCSSNSSGTHFHSKPNCHSKNPDVPNLYRPRSKPSKENDFPRPTSRNLGKDGRSLLSRRPTSKPVPRSKLLSASSNSSSGTDHFRLNSKNLKEKHEGIGSGTHIVLPQRFEQPKYSNSYDNRTPFGKNNGEAVESDSISGNTSGAKTPPIEASVSPEIQFGADVTPVCYGISHLLSGVRDKRKCRSRGILITGEEMAIVEDGDSNAKSRPSFVPSPSEASMIWLSSPNHDVKVSKSLDEPSSSTLKNCSQFLSGFASDIDHTDDEKTSGKTRIVLISPKRFPSFHGSGAGEVMGDFSSPSSLIFPSNEPSCSQISTSSLSCGNVVQTPTSDFSSDKVVERKLYLDAEIPRLLNIPDSNSLNQNDCYNKLEDLVASCVSDSTLASMSLSGMRISWREGLASQTFDTDELDYCKCFSDEDHDCNPPQTSSPRVVKSPGSRKLEDDSGVEKENEALFQDGTNVSAESICLDGDMLIASGDSDWTLSYKNHLFQV